MNITSKTTLSVLKDLEDQIMVRINEVGDLMDAATEEEEIAQHDAYISGLEMSLAILCDLRDPLGA